MLCQKSVGQHKVIITAENKEDLIVNNDDTKATDCISIKELRVFKNNNFNNIGFVKDQNKLLPNKKKSSVDILPHQQKVVLLKVDVCDVLPASQQNGLKDFRIKRDEDRKQLKIFMQEKRKQLQISKSLPVLDSIEIKEPIRKSYDDNKSTQDENNSLISFDDDEQYVTPNIIDDMERRLFAETFIKEIHEHQTNNHFMHQQSQDQALLDYNTLIEQMQNILFVSTPEDYLEKSISPQYSGTSDKESDINIKVNDGYEEEDSDEFEEEELQLDEAINYDDWNIIDDENTVENIDGIHNINADDEDFIPNDENYRYEIQVRAL